MANVFGAIAFASEAALAFEKKSGGGGSVQGVLANSTPKRGPFGLERKLVYLIFSLWQVSTGAYKRQVHEVPLGKQVTEAMIIEKITWASWTR